MPVNEMLARLTSRELAELRAYYRIKAEDREKDNLANKSRADVKRGRFVNIIKEL